MIKSGEIDKTEAWDEYNRMINFEGNYSSYMTELTAILGTTVVYKTTHIQWSAWDRSKEEVNNS